MPGQTGTIGGSFLELRRIINRIKDKSRIGICLDTCHAFAAGQYSFCAGNVYAVLTTQCRSVAKSVGCFQQRLCLFVCLFVYLFVCQHDNFRTSKRRMMKLGVRCVVQKFQPSSNFGVIAPSVCTPKMWRWATTLGKSVQAV